jgi:peptidoglycan/LPS O-acetylase OafA/YrhL
MSKDKNFREDIAGLRALAVMLVLLCHFRIPGFSFGFIGVDIFFVISGFLITRILYKEYLSSSNGNPMKSTISLSNFYLRRIRRLLPAAFTIIIVVNIVSFFLYNPISRETLLLNSKWALLFLANVSFLRSESDYFQQNNEPSMLQHYWSLSVEEQFYFIWPILFLIAANLQRLKLRKIFIRFNVRILILIAVVSLSSFLFLHYGFRLSPTEAYFSIFTRAWELGIGSFLGILAFHKKQNSVYSKLEQYAPLTITILISAILINDKNWANFILLPVLATGFFLYSGQNSSVNNSDKKLTKNLFHKLTQYLGTISYSLYLVHWPIFIIASHLNLIDSLIGKVLLIPVSVFFAQLLWKNVEIRFQKIPLPKKSVWDEKIFIFMKTRRAVIGSVAFLVVGSLYVVTYPDVSTKIFYSENALAKLKNDPNLQSFAKYEDKILLNGNVSPENNIALSDTSTLGSPQDLNALTSQTINALELGITKTKLSSSEISLLSSVSKDFSPFENSLCNYKDTEVPQDCSSGSKSPAAKKVALIGDSKMGHFAQPLIEYFTKKDWKVVPLSMDGCHLSDPVGSSMKNCAKRSKWVLDNISKEKYDLVISAEWPGTIDYKYQKSYFQLIQSNTKKFIIFQTNSKITSPTDCIKSDYSWEQSCIQVPNAMAKPWVDGLASMRALKSENTFIIESQKWICVDIKCPITSNGRFVTRDGSHMTYSYVRLITPLINATLDSLYTW